MTVFSKYAYDLGDGIGWRSAKGEYSNARGAVALLKQKKADQLTTGAEFWFRGTDGNLYDADDIEIDPGGAKIEVKYPKGGER